MAIPMFTVTMEGILAQTQTPSPQGMLEEGLRFFSDGGVFMALLILTSLIAVTVMVFKTLTLTRAKVVPGDLQRMVEKLGRRSVGNDAWRAISVAGREGRSTLARLCAVALGHRQEGIDDPTEAVEAQAREEVVRMQVGLPTLEVVITIAPLLGLLGTASGLVLVFGGLGETTDHVAIARGIGRALNTTIVGLAVSLPCVIAHSYFTRRIEQWSARLEVLLGHLVRVAKSDAGGGAPGLPEAAPDSEGR